MSDPNPNSIPTRTVSPSSIGVTGPGGFETIAEPARAPAAVAYIGEYALLGELGRGGMGVVYRAEDPHLRREVALKAMLPQFADNPDAKARFLREARAQAKVEHDHVAAIFQVSGHDGLPYLVMPLLKGMTLQAALKANPRPPFAEVIRIGREVAEGLAAAHEQGLVHRDIKPANVWLEGKKLRVKILDFGLARAAINADAAGETDGPVTREGGVVGTPQYMSPEQARGESVDGRTDLFSLGVVLYQMTTGELPFRGANTLAILTALAVGNAPPPMTVNPAVPPALSDFVMRLLAKDRADRPPTAENVAEELNAIASGLANTARVVALDSRPPIALAQVGTDPFAVLDGTNENASPALTPVPTPRSGADRTDAATKRRGVPTWALAGGVLLTVAGLVGLVASQLGKKPADVVRTDDSKANQAPPPVPPDSKGALPTTETVLFGGKDLSQWQSLFSGEPMWTVRDGYAEGVAGGENIVSKELFGDHEVRLEYWLPPGVEVNSGVYLQACYEIQILDDAGKPPGTDTSGALYDVAAPRVNASKPAGQWQTLDITFTAPRGKASGRVSVVHNGVKVLDAAEVTEPTLLASPELRKGDRGPLMLENSQQVRFRNIRVRPRE
jgi:serine/threonine protein kinase